MLSIESRPDSYGTSRSEQKKEEDEMNKVILMGRLTKAPEIKYLQDDNKTAMARYMLAVDRRYGKDREREGDSQLLPVAGYRQPGGFVPYRYPEG